MKIEANRIPSLDGLRAISILMVLFSHGFRPKYIDFGGLGVKIFFVISSYLIVGILLNDINKDKFSLKRFYFKRILRTFPVYYFYLIVVFVLLHLLNMFDWSQFWRAPLYLTNYQPRSEWKETQWFVGHSWSLAVEEQFYLLIAGLFFLVNKKIINIQKSIYILISIVLIIPVIRVCYLYFNFIPDIFRGSLHRSFETVADSLAVGGLIAVLKNDIFNNKWILFFKNKMIFLMIFILIITMLDNPEIVHRFGYKPRYLYNLAGLTVINISIGIILINCITINKDSYISKFLNNKLMTTIGLWSYSIYIWQQVWLFSWDFPLVFKFVGIFCCTVFSYYCIELPFLKIRDNYLKKNKV